MTLVCVLWATAAGGGEPPRWEVVLEASTGEVWDSLTTQEGLEAWMAPRVLVDFRQGGLIRANYDPMAGEDDPNWIHTRILAYEPERVLCLQTARSPAGFPYADLMGQVFSVIRLEPISRWRTRLVMTTVGWGEGQRWDELLAAARPANDLLLNRLREIHADPERPDPLEILRRMANGVWEHRSTINGAEFRVRNRLFAAGGGRAVLMLGEQDTGQGLEPYSGSIAWEDPASGACLFVSVARDGSITRGEIRARDQQTLEWDWTSREASGQARAYLVRTRMLDEASYEMAIYEDEGDGEPIMAPVLFRR